MRVTFVIGGYARDPVGGVRVIYNYANGLVALSHYDDRCFTPSYKSIAVRITKAASAATTPKP